MPILDWSTGDVFEFLKKYKRWDGKDFGYLLELYNVKEGNGCWTFFLEVAEKYPEALGYDIDELKEKLRKIIEK
jgi:DNA sulfur modification protein DndC